MKKLIIIFIVLFTLIGCAKEIKKSEHTSNDIEINDIESAKLDTTNAKQKTDEIKLDSNEENKEIFREHKSIHQIEWEEHQDSTKANSQK